MSSHDPLSGLLNGLDIGGFAAVNQPMKDLRSPAPQQRTTRPGNGTSRLSDTPLQGEPRWGVPGGTPVPSMGAGSRDPFSTISHDATPTYRVPSPMR